MWPSDRGCPTASVARMSAEIAATQLPTTMEKGARHRDGLPIGVGPPPEPSVSWLVVTLTAKRTQGAEGCVMTGSTNLFLNDDFLWLLSRRQTLTSAIGLGLMQRMKNGNHNFFCALCGGMHQRRGLVRDNTWKPLDMNDECRIAGGEHCDQRLASSLGGDVFLEPASEFVDGDGGGIKEG